MRRKYSDRERAEALAAYDACGSLTEVSKMTGIPDSTLSAWINHNQGINDDIPDLRSFKKLELADKLETIAHQCAGLLPERLPSANVREIVGAMGQSIEKSQLLRGQPTEIHESVSVSSALLKSIEKAAKRDKITENQASIELFEALSDEPGMSDPSAWGRFQGVIEAHLAEKSEDIREISGEQ